MFKVLPQMHRLVEQICAEYRMEIDEIVVDTEGVKEFPDGRIGHFPYYIVRLKPNGLGWRLISCRPHKGRHIDFSASQNNVTVVVFTILGEAFVIPSWRGKLVPWDEMDKHTYHIKAGYMITEPGIDYIEQSIIREAETGYGRIHRGIG